MCSEPSPPLSTASVRGANEQAESTRDANISPRQRRTDPLQATKSKTQPLATTIECLQKAQGIRRAHMKTKYELETSTVNALYDLERKAFQIL